MAAEEYQVALVRDALQRASDIGEQRSRAQLQQECGLGSGDLEAVLEELRGAGEATEVAPDAFEAMSEEVREARAAARADDEDAGAEEGADEEPEPHEGRGPAHLPSLAEAERAAGRGAPSAGGAPPVAKREVRLTMGVAGALDEAALGQLVKAGIDEARGDGAVFILTVSP